MGVDGAWWLPWSSKPVRPDDVGLGGFDSHALPPGRGVQPPVTILTSRATSAVLGVLALLAAPTLSAQQRTDTSAAVVDTVQARPEMRPPLSPRRAFLYSLVLPGYAQSVLGRHRAGALEIAFEAAALTMIRISAADLREAKRNLRDSIPVSFVSANGAPEIRWVLTPYHQALVRARKAHVEDWIAVLIGNHLFSAADAYVAALLWDLPAEVALRATPRSAGLAFTLRW